jgi:glycosyltransferase involved in cell wall biosynthesis
MIAYILAGFPSRSEFFILNEILSLTEKGIDIKTMAIRRSAPLHTVPGAAGVGVVYYHAPSAAKAHGYAILTYRRRYWTVLVQLLREAGSAKAGLKALKDLSIAVFFLFSLRKSNVTHIHAHFLSLPTRIAMIMSRIAGIPFSASAHAQDIYTTSREKLTGILRHLKFIVTCTASNKVFLDRMIRGEESAKVIHIYHGIDCRRWEPKSLRKESAADRPIRLLTAARLVEKKGIIYLLRAMRELTKSNYDVHLSIIGDGPLYESFSSYIQAYGLGSRVKLCGSMGQDSLRTYCGESDIFVLPSVVATDGDQDGLPNVLVESLAIGLPVVTTAVSAIPELILHGQTGLIIAERDARGIADAVIRLSTDTLLYNALQLAGRKLVTNRFNIDYSTHRLADLFEIRCISEKNFPTTNNYAI